MIDTTCCSTNSNAAANDNNSGDQSEESARNLQRDVLSNIRVDSRYFAQVLADVQPLDDDEDICRICHEKSTPELPFITPCSCTGSQRYVHQSCLMQWIKTSKMPRCYICNFQYIMSFSFKYFMKRDRKEMLPRNWCNDLYTHSMLIVYMIISIWSVVNILCELKDPETELCTKDYLPFWLNCTFQQAVILFCFSVGFFFGTTAILVFGKRVYRRWNIHCLVVTDAPKKNTQKCKKAFSNSEITVIALSKSDKIQLEHTELEEVSDNISKSTGGSLQEFSNNDTSSSVKLQKDIFPIVKAETGTNMTAVSCATPCSYDSKGALISVVVM